MEKWSVTLIWGETPEASTTRPTSRGVLMDCVCIDGLGESWSRAEDTMWCGCWCSCGALAEA